MGVRSGTFLGNTMFGRLLLLSLGSLLIAVLNAQYFRPQHGYYPNNWADPDPERHRYDHHGHHHHHGHHGHRSHNEYQAPYPSGYQYWPSQGQRPVGYGYDDQRTSNSRFQPGQPQLLPAGNGNGPFFQPGRDAGNPIQPHPDSPFQQSEHNQGGGSINSQSPTRDGSAINPLQPRPGQDFDFQQPINEPEGSGHRLQPRPGQGFDFQQPGLEPAGLPIQPRPVPEFRGASPGAAGNPLQPRPTPPYQTDSDAAGSTIQARPFPNGHEASSFNFQTPGSAGNPLQPRPGSVDPSGFQQPGSELVGKTLQPKPDQDQPKLENVDDKIRSIFNTQDFVTGSLSDNRGQKDLNLEAKPESVEGRFLLNTDPICTGGTEMRAGHCRPKA